ncbi:MAG: proline racemase family protein [Proteobacteria bacterium]|nr:proline racemase family protein [Pseudomonadota bacterium]
MAFDQHLVAAARLIPARIEKARILEQDLRHRRSPRKSRRHPTPGRSLALQSGHPGKVQRRQLRAIAPSISGRARRHGINTIFVDDRDPFAHGLQAT